MKISRDTSAAPGALTRDEFAVLYTERFRYFRVVAAAYTPLDQADDVVQRAALNAMRHLNDFDRNSNFNAWFSAFVRGEARNHERSRRRGLLRLTRFRSERSGVSETHRDGGLPPKLSSRLQECLKGLSEIQRECILLRVLSECTFSQIAAVTGESEPTSRSHVHRARSRLADCLGPSLTGATDE